MTSLSTPPIRPRLSWIDITKGISILWIVFFHLFIAYAGERYPWPLRFVALPGFMATCSSGSILHSIGCLLDGLAAAIFQRGSQAVGVFVVLSGFGLTYAMAPYDAPSGGWMNWYRRRLLRLFPMYWVAHFVCLASLFPSLKDSLGWRFLSSLLGNRIVPADVMFYYLVPAWWFFGLLVELYVVFPLLYRLLRRIGPIQFVVYSGLFTILTRYLLQDVLQAHGNWSQGAFFGARLWEFAAGMALAYYYRHHPGLVEEHFFAGTTLLAGICLYVLGTYSYQPVFTYTLTDAFIGIGLFIVTAHISRWIESLPGLRSVLVYVGAYSYGLYLLHQPFVMLVGEQLRPYGMPLYILCASLVTATITFASILLERLVNRISERLFSSQAACRTATPHTQSQRP